MKIAKVQTLTYALVGGRQLHKLLRPPGMVNTIGRRENSPRI